MSVLVRVAAIVFLMTPCQALAYLDPGTGSLVLQVIVAGIIAASVALRHVWGRLLNTALRAFRRSSRPGSSGEDGPT